MFKLHLIQQALEFTLSNTERARKRQQAEDELVPQLTYNKNLQHINHSANLK